MGATVLVRGGHGGGSGLLDFTAGNSLLERGYGLGWGTRGGVAYKRGVGTHPGNCLEMGLMHYCPAHNPQGMGRCNGLA